jgi:hypothetical protein
MILNLFYFIAWFSLSVCPVHPIFASPVNSENVETLLNPFRPGPVFESNFYDTDTPVTTNRTMALQFYFGWSPGLTTALTIPLSLWNNPPSFERSTTPRIGGSPNNRIEIDNYFRFWGDASDYFGLEAGIGLPFQSDGALDGTEYNTWSVPTSVIFRITPIDQIAFQASVTDTWMSPVVSGTSSGDTYTDYTNSIGFVAYLSAFPKSHFAPYFKWSDTLAVEKDSGLDTGGSSFLQKENSGSETRTLGVGFDSVPFSQSILLSIEYEYKIFPNEVYPQLYFGRFKWAF